MSRRHGSGSSTGSADRLPAPVKERRPALAALAVIMIVGGALASGMLVLRSGERDDYLVVRSTINPGRKIVDTDLGVAQIAGTGAHAVAAARRSDIVGRYATTRIFPGTLITYEMVTKDNEIPDGWAVVGAVLSTNQRPAAPLRPGDLVRVLSVPRADGTDDGQATILLNSAEVRAVEETPTNGAIAVSLLVPVDRVQPVAAAAAQGTVALALLPGLAPVGANAAPPTAGQQPAAPGAEAGQPQSQQPQTQIQQQPQQQPLSGQPTLPTQATTAPAGLPPGVAPGTQPGTQPGVRPGTGPGAAPGTVAPTPAPGTP
jgi:hypothetical protein